MARICGLRRSESLTNLGLRVDAEFVFQSDEIDHGANQEGCSEKRLMTIGPVKAYGS